MQFRYSLALAVLISRLPITVADNFQGPNIALYQTTSEHPESSTGSHGKFAVDDNLKNNVNSGDIFSHTSFSETVASWTIMLDQAYSITGIILLNRKAVEWRIRLKNFKVLGDGQELYSNQETTGSCLDETYSGIRTVPSFCDETVRIPLGNAENIKNITILVNSHTADSNYPNDDIFTDDGKRAILTLCEVQIFATVCLLPDIANGHVAVEKNYTTPGSTASVNCNEGFLPSRRDVTCTVLRKWSPLPTCNLVHCGLPGDIRNGIYTNENQIEHEVNISLPYLTTIFAKCNIGFERKGGSFSRQCLANGTWNGSSPVCEPVQCQHPGNILNGRYINQDNNDNYTFGSLPYLSIITALCRLGYKSTSAPRSCQSNKMWSGKASTCDAGFCSPTNQLNNGYYAFKENATTYFGNTSLEYDTKLIAMCFQGYTLRYGNAEITCKADGTWTEPDPFCDRILCSVPSAKPGVQRQFSILLSGKTVPINATMNETCSENYQSDTLEVIRRCTEIGSFDGTEIICEHSPEAVNKPFSSPLGAAVGGTAGALVVVTVALVVVIFLRRRRLSRAGDKSTNVIYDNSTPPPDSNAYGELREV